METNERQQMIISAGLDYIFWREGLGSVVHDFNHAFVDFTDILTTVLERYIPYHTKNHNAAIFDALYDAHRRVRALVNAIRRMPDIDDTTEWESVSSCVEEARLRIDRMLRIGGIKCVVNIDDELSNALVPNPFTTISLMILLQNSIHSLRCIPTQRGGVVNINCESEKSNIVISVSDNGIGALDEHIQLIGTPGFSTKNGTGLGLYSIIENAKQYDAAISIRNNQTRGLAVSIIMPFRSTK